MSKVRHSFAVVFTALFLAGPAFAAGYAEERARIEDLMARYLFAMDWQDARSYAATFAEDGVLVHGLGEERGREAIEKFVAKWRADIAARAEKETPGMRPAKTRHFVSNLVLDIKGNRATARAYWTMLNNNNPQRSPVVQAYGHYEDELVKKNGKWLFARRAIFNEQLEQRASSDVSPLEGMGF